jgi:hypothetical protein
VGWTPWRSQQRRAECRLHAADARARRGNSQVHTLGAMSDTARLDNVNKQVQIGQIETHRLQPFEFREPRLRQLPLVLKIGAPPDFVKHEGS